MACARGRLPPSFLERRLADLGLSGVPPLPGSDIARLEHAVDLVNAIAAGRPIPGGVPPAAALDAAFPADHPTLAALRRLADEYLAALRPSKRDKREAASSAPPSAAPPRAASAPPPASAGEARPASAPPAARHEPPAQAAPAEEPRRAEEPRAERGARETRPARAPRALRSERTPRVSWESWLAYCFPAVSELATAAPAPAASELPPALASWTIDDEARRCLLRIRERMAHVEQARERGEDLAPALRELAFAILRAPLEARDELRTMIADAWRRRGLACERSALYPPPSLSVMKRRWEALLAERGPEDPQVQAAWEQLLAAHPEARAKLEQERQRELQGLLERLRAVACAEGADAAAVQELRARLVARFAGVEPRIAEILAAARAAEAAVAHAGKLIAERHWEDPEVQAALAALDERQQRRFAEQRQRELAELTRRFATALREQGPDAEATQAAQARLAARFPSEAAAAERQCARARRERALAEQERAREAAGRALSGVHLGSHDHRLSRLAPHPRWRLLAVVAEPLEQGGQRRGVCVVLALPDDAALPPAGLPAGWRADACADLEQLDRAVQTLLDAPQLGILGVTMAEDEAPSAAQLQALRWALLVLERRGPQRLVIESPASAEERAALLSALRKAAPSSELEIVEAARTEPRWALAEALALSWLGERAADRARIAQSGLLDGCLLAPPAALRETIQHLGEGRLPPTAAIHGLLDLAAEDSGGVIEALLAAVGDRLGEDSEALLALHRQLLSRGRGGDPAHRARALAWLDGIAEHLCPRERLRLGAAAFAAQAANEGVERERVARLLQRFAELREDYPAEVTEAALTAAAAAREACDLEHAELLIAPWQRADAIACGGRLLALRLAEERARLAAATGRWKDALRHLERAGELAQRLADARERAAASQRLSALRAAVLADDPHASDAERQAALAEALGAAPSPALAGELAERGSDNRRLAHLALLAVAVRRQDEVLIGAYLARRERWCQPRDAQAWAIAALRAVILAASDAEAARAQLALARERAGTLAERLAVLAAATSAQLLGAAQRDLREQLHALRRQSPLAASTISALERALARHPDTAAALKEALPLLPRP
ncbi:MAG: hypothetical protein N3B15_02390 [Planctomycetota bacterium]|nr:hypothetical protein [Planctomycetota bacterium]